MKLTTICVAIMLHQTEPPRQRRTESLASILCVRGDMLSRASSLLPRYNADYTDHRVIAKQLNSETPDSAVHINPEEGDVLRIPVEWSHTSTSTLVRIKSYHAKQNTGFIRAIRNILITISTLTYHYTTIPLYDTRCIPLYPVQPHIELVVETMDIRRIPQYITRRRQCARQYVGAIPKADKKNVEQVLHDLINSALRLVAITTNVVSNHDCNLTIINPA